MGAWGIGNFQNDKSRDFLANLRSKPSAEALELIADLLRVVGEQSTSNDEKVLAAAEVVAALNGQGLSGDFPSAAREWVATLQREPRLSSLALAAVQRLRMQSELRALWEESGELEGWLQVVDNLVVRLSGSQVGPK